MKGTLVRTLSKLSKCFLISLACSPLVLAAEPAARLELVAGGLDFPVSIQNAGDGSGRIFVAELSGKVRIVRDGDLLQEAFLDLSDRVIAEGEGGLLGLAFHPQFSENGRFFVLYTGELGASPVRIVSEFQVSAADPDKASIDETVVLTIARPSDVHHGGDLAFGPDGYLYMSSGDGGPGNDPDKKAQDLGSLLGKILRIGVDGPDEPYTIPANNPFVGQEGARGEIWAYGFRNPFRMGFDPITGRLFVGDVGSTLREEINLVVRGGNYGWSTLEGTLCFPAVVAECDREGKVAPIHEYEQAESRSVIGGRVYRGAQTAGLWGRYIFGDFVSGRIWTLREVRAGVWQRSDLVKADFLVAVFGEDEAGEIYVADLLGGALYRLDFFFRTVFAQVADGAVPDGTFQSIVQLVNNGEQVADGLLIFRNADGSPRQIALEGQPEGSEFPFSLPPGTTRTWTTPGSSAPVFAGWAEASSDQPISGTVLFTFREMATGQIHRAGVAESPRGTVFTAPLSIDPALVTNVGLALANPSPNDSAHIRVVVSDSNGQVLIDYEEDLGPLERRAAFIDELGQLPSPFEGTVRIFSDRDIAPTLLLTFRGLPSASLSPGS